MVTIWDAQNEIKSYSCWQMTIFKSLNSDAESDWIW